MPGFEFFAGLTALLFAFFGGMGISTVTGLDFVESAALLLFPTFAGLALLYFADQRNEKRTMWGLFLWPVFAVTAYSLLKRSAWGDALRASIYTQPNDATLATIAVAICIGTLATGATVAVIAYWPDLTERLPVKQHRKTPNSTITTKPTNEGFDYRPDRFSRK